MSSNDDNEAEKNERPSVPVMEPTTSARPDIVYHYCNAETLVSIVTNKSLRMSSIFYMNDTAEHYHLRQHAQAHINAHREQFTSGIEHLGVLENMLGHSWSAPIFASCFSNNPDVLSQWRNYGDEGKGYAIGFNFKYLQQLANLMQAYISDIIYDDEVQKRMIADIFSRELDRPKPRYTNILNQTYALAARCKSDGFREETEWRMVWSPIADDPLGFTGKRMKVQFRSSPKGYVIPYYTIPLIEMCDFKTGQPLSPISSISYGCHSKTVFHQTSVEEMLLDAGWLDHTYQRVLSTLTMR